MTDFLALHDRLRQQMIARPEPSTALVFDLDSTVLTVYGRQEKAEVAVGHEGAHAELVGETPSFAVGLVGRVTACPPDGLLT